MHLEISLYTLILFTFFSTMGKLEIDFFKMRTKTGISLYLLSYFLDICSFPSGKMAQWIKRVDRKDRPAELDCQTPGGK